MSKRNSKLAKAAGAACRRRCGHGTADWISGRLQQGLACQRAGRLGDAEKLYREVLAVDHEQPDALHLLGLLASERGSHELAVDLISAAIRFNPRAALFHADLGLAASRQGDWKRAISAYCRAIELEPANARPLLELGRTLEQQGQAMDALLAYREAQRLDPGLVEGACLEADLLCRTGQLERAAMVYRRAIELDPRHRPAHHQLANLLYLEGRFEEAELHYRAALTGDPERVEARYRLGLSLARAGKWALAAAEFAAVLEQDPRHADAAHEQGNALHCLGELEEAMEAYRRALRLRADRPETHFNLGVTLSRRKLFDDAIECYTKAIALRPDYAEAHNNLATLMQVHGRVEDALGEYERAIRAAPEWSAARYNRALALQQQGRLGEAAEGYRELLVSDPGHLEAVNNLGNTLVALCRPAEAIEWYQAAIRMADPVKQPELLRQSRWNLALAQLVTGDFRAGWEGYEWRAKPAAHESQPLWTGTDFRGQTLLVWAEQGLGDTVQFARYLEMVKRRGGELLLECRAEMVTLLREAGVADGVIERGATLPPFAYQVPLMSLPRIFGTELRSIPARVPYLRAGAASLARWAERLGPRHSRRVGLVWAGNPAHQNDRNRSMSFADLAPLARLPGIAWVSLQKQSRLDLGGDCEWRGKLDDLGDELGDVRDTAAVLLSLDLVIGVDTMVTHLAGALARPVWTLLPYAPDWRWLLDRTDSPWYPTMRLFRQPEPGDWGSVIEQVRQALLMGA